MADKIIFQKKLNDSVQVGDELYYSIITPGSCSIDPSINTTKTLCDTAGGTWTDPVVDTPTSLGDIIATGEKWVKIDSAIGTVGQNNPDLITSGGFNIQWDVDLVSNGTFDTDLTGWTSSASLIGTNFYHAASDPFSTGMDSTDTYTLDGSNRIYLDDVAEQGSSTGYIYQDLTGLEVGERYKFRFDYQLDAGTLVFDPSPSANWNNTISLTGTGTHTAFLDASIDNVKLLFAGATGNNVWGYIDNVTVQKLLPAANWYVTGSGWDIIGQSRAKKISGTADWLNQDLSPPLVEGEEYTLEMDIVGGSGGIKIANAATGGANVDVVVDTGVGTATWIQGSTNLDRIRIWQNNTGDAEIDNITLHMTSFDLETALGGTTPNNLFFMFRKPVGENVSSLKGYYAEVEFSLPQNVTTKQELFAVGSEVTISSK